MQIPHKARVKTSSILNLIRSMCQIERTSLSTSTWLRKLWSNTILWYCTHLETPPQSVLSPQRTWLRTDMPTTSLWRQRPLKLRSPEEIETREVVMVEMVLQLSDSSREQNSWSLWKSRQISIRTWRNSTRSRRKTRSTSLQRKLWEKSKRPTILLNDRRISLI